MCRIRAPHRLGATRLPPSDRVKGDATRPANSPARSSNCSSGSSAVTKTATCCAPASLKRARARAQRPGAPGNEMPLRTICAGKSVERRHPRQPAFVGHRRSPTETKTTVARATAVGVAPGPLGLLVETAKAAAYSAGARTTGSIRRPGVPPAAVPPRSTRPPTPGSGPTAGSCGIAIAGGHRPCTAEGVDPLVESSAPGREGDRRPRRTRRRGCPRRLPAPVGFPTGGRARPPLWRLRGRDATAAARRTSRWRRGWWPRRPPRGRSAPRGPVRARRCGRTPTTHRRRPLRPDDTAPPASRRSGARPFPAGTSEG